MIICHCSTLCSVWKTIEGSDLFMSRRGLTQINSVGGQLPIPSRIRVGGPYVIIYNRAAKIYSSPCQIVVRTMGLCEESKQYTGGYG